MIMPGHSNVRWAITLSSLGSRAKAWTTAPA